MAGQLVQGKGLDPATPSNGYTTTFPDFTTGQMKSIADSGVKSILSPNDRPNLLMNSGLWIAQRQAPATLTTYSATADRAKGPDGWAFTNENASVQYIRTDTSSAAETGLQNRYYGSVTKITANGKIVLSQAVEGTDCQAVRGRSVRVQFKLKSTTAMTLRLGLAQLTSAGTVDSLPATFVSAFGGASVDPTFGTNVSLIAPKSGVTGDNCTASGNAFNCSVTTTWQRFGGVFDVPASAKNVIILIWSDSQITTTNGFSWTECGCFDGMEIQDWTPLALAVEYTRCFRHYQKSFVEALAPVQNAGVGTGEYRAIAGKATAVANAGFIPIVFSVLMRNIPAITVFNPAAANALARNITGAADMGATAVTSVEKNGFYTNSTGVAATAVGDLIAIHWTAEAGL